jgi:hypothetical protein
MLQITTRFLNFLHLDQSCFRDKVNGAVGRRTVVMVFASPSANFCTGSNSRRLSGHSHRDNFIATRNISPLIGTMQKHMPTLTRSATKSTSGPLYVMLRTGLKAKLTRPYEDRRTMTVSLLERDSIFQIRANINYNNDLQDKNQLRLHQLPRDLRC